MMCQNSFLNTDLFLSHAERSRIFRESISKQLTYRFAGCSVCKVRLTSPFINMTVGRTHYCQSDVSFCSFTQLKVHQHPKFTLIKPKPLHTWTLSSIDLRLSRLPSLIETDGGVKARGRKAGQRSHGSLLANSFILVQLLSANYY